MLATILIIIGVVLLIPGLVLFVALMLEPLISSIGIVFGRDPKYALYNTTKASQNMLESRKQALRGSSAFLIIVGILLIAIGSFIKYSPRGNDSLLSENTAGLTAGDGMGETGALKEASEEEQQLAALAKDYRYIITVREDLILLNNEPMQDIDALQAALREISTAETVLILDDYASASAYHTVRECVDALRLSFDEEATP